MPGKLVLCSQISLLETNFRLLINILGITDGCLSHSHREIRFIVIFLSTLYYLHLEGLKSPRNMGRCHQIMRASCLFRRKISLGYPVCHVSFQIQNRALQCIDIGCFRDSLSIFSWLYKSAFKESGQLWGLHYRILHLIPVLNLLWGSSSSNVFSVIHNRTGGRRLEDRKSVNSWYTNIWHQCLLLVRLMNAVTIQT